MDIRKFTICIGAILITVLILLNMAFADHSVKWDSPRLLISPQQLESLHRKIEAGIPDVVEAYELLLWEAKAYLDTEPQPISGELRVPRFYRDKEGHRAQARPIRGQSRTTHVLALAYALSGEEAFGQKAKEYLFAWVNELTGPAHGGDIWDLLIFRFRADTPIVIGTAFPNFIYAYDLLRAMGMLSYEEEVQFRDWLQKFVKYYIREEFYPNNHHNWQSLFLLCASQALQDKELFERAISYYKGGLRVQIASEGRLPRELRRGEKAGTYTLMALEAMVQFVAVAENHGINLHDLKSRTGNTLKDAIDYLADFVIDPMSWQVQSSHDLITPAHPGEWGYLFVFPLHWWGEKDYEQVVGERPYGHHTRAYTLLFPDIYVYGR